ALNGQQLGGSGRNPFLQTFGVKVNEFQRRMAVGFRVRTAPLPPPPAPARRPCPSRGTSSWPSSGAPRPSPGRRCASTACRGRGGSGQRGGACRASLLRPRPPDSASVLPPWQAASAEPRSLRGGGARVRIGPEGLDRGRAP